MPTCLPYPADTCCRRTPSALRATQTVRHTQLEQAKHCLVLLKKACRAQTAVSWKQLRQAMEQELAQRLAEQQADLAEQLAFVQVGSTYLRLLDADWISATCSLGSSVQLCIFAACVGVCNAR